MRKLSFALLAIAAGFTVQAAVPGFAHASPAGKAAAAVTHSDNNIVQVRRDGRHYRHHRGFNRHRGFHRHRYWRPRFHFYGGGGCHWMKRRAIHTGSHYWWRRYNACRYGW